MFSKLPQRHLLGEILFFPTPRVSPLSALAQTKGTGQPVDSGLPQSYLHLEVSPGRYFANGQGSYRGHSRTRERRLPETTTPKRPWMPFGGDAWYKLREVSHPPHCTWLLRPPVQVTCAPAQHVPNSSASVLPAGFFPFRPRPGALFPALPSALFSRLRKGAELSGKRVPAGVDTRVHGRFKGEGTKHWVWTVARIGGNRREQKAHAF